MEPEVWYVDLHNHECCPKAKSRFVDLPSWATEFVPKKDYDKLKDKLELAIDLLHRVGIDLSYEGVQSSRTRDDAGKVKGQLAVERTNSNDSKNGCDGDPRAGESA